MNQNPAIKHWNQTKLALLIAVVTTIFTNIFWGILVFLAIGFWVSRNEPVPADAVKLAEIAAHNFSEDYDRWEW